MCKKVLFVIKEMHMGGARKSLCSLLNALSRNSKLKLYLLNMSSTGELLTEIPSSVMVLDVTANMKGYFAQKNELSLSLLIRKAILRLLYKLRLGDKILNYLIREWCKINRITFDVVVGGQEGISDEAALKIPGKKHIVWFHCDYDKYCTIVDETNKETEYSKADSIIFVSEKSRVAFSTKYPVLSDRCKVIKNIIDKNEILNKAEQIPAYRFQGKEFRVVSVGRMSAEKGFDRILEIVKRLKAKNIDVEWVIIGGGALLEEYRTQVREGKQDSIHFIGPTTNPYPIVKQADLYVMTSHFEAQPLVLIEALILGIPVISTDFSSVREVISETQKYGEVVENSVNGIADCMAKLICEDKISEMKEAVRSFRYNNDDIIARVTEELLN